MNVNHFLRLSASSTGVRITNPNILKKGHSLKDFPFKKCPQQSILLEYKSIVKL